MNNKSGQYVIGGETRGKVEKRSRLERRIKRSLRRQLNRKLYGSRKNSALFNRNSGSERGEKADASCWKSLLDENLPRIAPNIPQGSDVVSIGIEDGREERMLLEALNERECSRFYVVAPGDRAREKAAEAVGDLSVEVRTDNAGMEDLHELERGWNVPALVSMLRCRFVDCNPEWLIPVVSKMAGEGGLFLFDCRLWPTGSAVCSGRDHRPIPAWMRRAFRGHGIEPDDCELVVRLSPHKTPWGEICKVDRRVRIGETADKELGRAAVDTEPLETIRLGTTYRYSGYQLERYLWQYGFGIEELAMCEEHEHALVLARKTPRNRTTD